MRKITLIQDIVISLLGLSICEMDASDELRNSMTEIKLNEIFKFADKHDLAHIVGDVLFKNNLMCGCEISDAFYKRLMFSLMDYRAQASELKAICDLFEANEIPYIPLKGSVLRHLYPDPWLRTCCDVDILIKEEYLHKASCTITQYLNGKNTFQGSHDWGFKTENGLYVELHFKLIEDYGKSGISRHKWSAKCLENVWQHAEKVSDKKFQFKMSDEIFYFYHIAHMAKHFENGGCGIKPFLDLWLLNNKIEFDKIKRYDLLKAEGLDKFEKAVFNLTEAWFSGKEKDSLSVLIEQYIFSGGVYGSKENYVVIQQNKIGGKIKYAVSRIFLPYDFLKIQYPIIKRHKWLFPVFQIVRWISRVVIFNRLPNMIKEFKTNKNVSLEEKETMTNLLKKLGL